jgi:hypothetical protein
MINSVIEKRSAERNVPSSVFFFRIAEFVTLEVAAYVTNFFLGRGRIEKEPSDR